MRAVRYHGLRQPLQLEDVPKPSMARRGCRESYRGRPLPHGAARSEWAGLIVTDANGKQLAPMDPFSCTDIVIISGGFGGMNAAMALDLRPRRGLKIDVTLISRSNFFLFTPLLAEVAASLVESRHAVSPIRRMLSRVRCIEGTVQTADPVRRTVGFVDQNDHSRLLSYQPCLLASGSVTEFFGIPWLAENALT